MDAAQGAVPVTAGSYLASAEDVAGLVVGSQGGKPLTRVSQAIDGAAIEIEFQDGRVAATTQKHF